jgi:hypothetical protein
LAKGQSNNKGTSLGIRTTFLIKEREGRRALDNLKLSKKGLGKV